MAMSTNSDTVDKDRGGSGSDSDREEGGQSHQKGILE